ncbi:21 kDa protein-like [Camellia sinensis]|uniref:21 kDa protein-like n=1 Tax=Camellia sinensis TaxID=4442 RepID=UPI001036F27E|nr:21 kDa protein-like [Camellia sinensis]
MAKLGTFLLLLLLLFSLHCIVTMADSAIAPDPTSTNFIKASCRATRYPILCVQCLSSYASQIQQSPKQLADAVLAVSLSKAQSTAVFVSKMTQVSGIKPREYQAVKDCIENMGDTVDQLKKSIPELNQIGRAGGQDFMWHMSNVQTWVSAALTDENTCVDGFSGPDMDGNVKASIKREIIAVAQVTSNALALVNRFATRHRASGTKNMP